MKKLILFFVFFLISSLSLFAQEYDDNDFVGTWKYSKTTIRLDSDDYAKVYWKDGSSSYGTWTYSYLFGNSLYISLNDSDLHFQVERKSNSSMTLWDVKAQKRYTFTKQGSSNNVDAAVVTTVIIGAALLWLMSDSDSGSSDYSPCSTCGGRGYVSSSNCPSGCPCPGCGG